MTSTRPRVEVFDVDGSQVRLRTLAPAGRVRATPDRTIVLVHGIGMSHRSYRHLHALLSRTHRTITADLPGHAGLPPAGRHLSIEDFGDLVLRALERDGTTDVIVVGHSMGAQVVTHMGRARPDIVAGVVLVAPVVDDRRRTVLQQALGLFLDGFVEGPRMNAVVLTDYLRSLRQYPSALVAMMRYSTIDAVARLHMPVLVLRGDRDPIARSAWVQRLTATVPEGTLVELPGPHQLPERRPADVARHIRRLALVVGSARRSADTAARPSGSQDTP